MVTTSIRDYRFAPAVGRWHLELVRLARSLGEITGDLLKNLDEEVVTLLDDINNPTSPSPSPDRMRYVFALSVLYDILRAGGRIQTFDSNIYVSWPNWHASNGRSITRKALEQLTEWKSLSKTERAQLKAVSAPSMSRQTLLRFLEQGEFWLESAGAKHPTGISYNTAFTLALRSWTMPYRDRPGRVRRFVVVGRHSEICSDPVVMGLIEIADDAPYSVERNELLGLQPHFFLQWLSKQANKEAIAAALTQRLYRLRTAILPIPEIEPSVPAADIIAGQQELLMRAGGRSQTAHDFMLKKRIAYLVRLAHGEIASQRLAQNEEVSAQDYSLREGIRAIRDLTVPRVHMEVTVCGAIPPFTHALGGKLVVTFLAHPQILSVTQRTDSSILRNIFDVEQVQQLLPNYGILALTTKGLYPSHSALYNRAEVPGIVNAIRLEKLGETKGQTATLFSARTAKLARLMQSAFEGRRLVSTVYGTGGAKRQRLIESAILSMGLPETFVHAGIRRPVYGLPMVRNPEGVIWAGEEPSWLVERGSNARSYSEQATLLWRKRWFGRVESRLQTIPEQIPGLLEALDSI